MLATVTGATGCATASDAAFCGPTFTGAINALAEQLADPATPDELGKAGTAVVLGHDAGCL
jgi:hypothetical protein